jgi:crotonobetainyl-CoA:carnitine CoA-transferase CaiB-like acyl-CoA transferase
MRPLDGTLVVSLEQAVAAPFATKQLADLGARIIKIERPGPGDFARAYDTTLDGFSAYFAWLNRGKESLTLDLKQPQAIAVMHRLLERADVLVQNLAPGAVERLGLGWKDVTGRYPRVICCDISGYGDRGPYREKKAYDLLIQAEAGLMAVTGVADSPARVGISIVDICSGMYGYSGVLSALLQRGRTGKGSRVEVSMFEALGEWMTQPLYYAKYGRTITRTGTDHSNIWPYGSFRTGDGKSVMLAIQNEREWASFCTTVLEQPGIATDPRFASNSARVANREALGTVLGAVFGTLTAEQLVGRLDRANIANSRRNEVAEVVAHPQLVARDRWRTMGSPVGPLPTLLPPATHSDFDPVLNPVPAVGEHTDVILRELGLSAQEIAALRAAGAA